MLPNVGTWHFRVWFPAANTVFLAATWISAWWEKSLGGKTWPAFWYLFSEDKSCSVWPGRLLQEQVGKQHILHQNVSKIQLDYPPKKKETWNSWLEVKHTVIVKYCTIINAAVANESSTQEHVGVTVGLKVQVAALWPQGCKLESLIPGCSAGAQQQHDEPVLSAPGSSLNSQSWLFFTACSLVVTKM